MSTNILEQIANDPEAYMVYFGEVLLRDWADNSQGESVEFWLDSDGEVHPFKKFKCNKRTPGGSRFLIMAIEIDDDEEAINQDMKRRVQNAMSGHIKGGKHSQAAAMLCKDVNFHEYIVHKLQRLPPAEKRVFSGTLSHSLFSQLMATDMRIVMENPTVGEELTVQFLYWWCSISSRRELDFKAKAFSEYQILRDEFYNWQSAKK